MTTNADGNLKGFELRCPMCGASESIALDLNDLTSCTCGECQDQYSPRAARAKAAAELAKWDAVIRWISLAKVSE
jgi:hypothetical protein